MAQEKRGTERDAAKCLNEEFELFLDAEKGNRVKQTRAFEADKLSK